MSSRMKEKSQYKKSTPKELEKITNGFDFLVTGIKTCGKSSAQYMQFKKDAGYLYERLLRAEEFAGDIARMKVETAETRHSLLIKMFGYLGLVESVGVAMINFSVVLLIVNGYNFHIDSRHASPRVRHATSIKDLEDERVSLGARFGFLEQNGLGFLPEMMGFPSKRKRSRYNLRNTVAHLNFRVDENGKIYYKETNREIDIDSEYGEELLQKLDKLIKEIKNQNYGSI